MEPTFVRGKPRLWLRLDGGVVFVASIFLFAVTHQSWWIYPVLLFVPDIFIMGYLRDTSVGASCYNVGHSYFLPSLAVLFGWEWHHILPIAVGIIWIGHIGMDRLLGYGLKYDDNFKNTHLGDLAKKKS
jgi:hypothetical protein